MKFVLEFKLTNSSITAFGQSFFFLPTYLFLKHRKWFSFPAKQIRAEQRAKVETLTGQKAFYKSLKGGLLWK